MAVCSNAVLLICGVVSSVGRLGSHSRELEYQAMPNGCFRDSCGEPLKCLSKQVCSVP